MSSPKHGSGSHWSISCCSSTPKGAAQRASESVPDRAAARACTSTESTPKSLVKKPGASRVPVTTTVSFATTSSENSTESTPPPFFVAYSLASAEAPAVSYGSACAAARADASDVL